MKKVDHIHLIDDAAMTDADIARAVGCHPAYVRSVRNVAKRRAALKLERMRATGVSVDVFQFEPMEK